ncbi:DUF523 and DUF1722 domain-containing protein [Marinactinospora endophytica]
MGAPVRYNGGHSRHRFLTDELDRHVVWVPVCPEAEIGLGTPRETLRLDRSADQRTRIVTARTGTDHTDAIAAVADRHEAQLRRLDGYVLKNRSPSCGLYGMPVFENGRRVDGKGRGVFAERLVVQHPGLPVEEQGRLCDPGLREHWVERVFAHARLRALFESDWRPRDLVAFHARHKLQLMAHDPEGYRRTGRIVAAAGRNDPETTEEDYTREFHTTMARRATPGKQTNALQHAFGMISPLLDDVRRHDLLATVDAYRAGRLPLSLPIALLRHHCTAERVEWACEQTYLAPFPEDLRLRNTVGV